MTRVSENLENNTKLLLESGSNAQKISLDKPSEKVIHDIHHLKFQDRAEKKSHALSFVNLNNGFLFAVFYSGSGEAKSDVSLYSSFFDLKKQTWQEPIQIIDKHKVRKDTGFFTNTIGNPSLLYTDEKMYLFFSSVSFGGWSSAKINAVTSVDFGKTWGKVQRLSISPMLNITYNVRQKPHLLAKNQILLPIYFELGIYYSAYLIINDDNGKITTQFNQKLTPIRYKALQPELVFDSDKLVFFSRTINFDEPFIVQTVQSEHGQFTTNQIGNLISPDSSVAAIKVSDELWLLIYNNTKDRRELHLAISTDKGISWKHLRQLAHGSIKLGYPSALIDEYKNIHIMYTKNRKSFTHHVISELQLLQWVDQLTKN